MGRHTKFMLQMDWVTEGDDWSDVVPGEQNDTAKPVVSIMYTKQFTEVMGYFRAMLLANEHSLRAFNLTSVVIQLNPANYTARHFRQLCLRALGNQIHTRDELAF